MKKILLAAYSLDIGGIEKALVTLANELQKKRLSSNTCSRKKTRHISRKNRLSYFYHRI